MNHVNHSQLLNNGGEKEGKAEGTLYPLYGELCSYKKKSVSVLQLASLEDISFPSKYCFFRGSCWSQEILWKFVKPNFSMLLEAFTEG